MDHVFIVHFCHAFGCFFSTSAFAENVIITQIKIIKKPLQNRGCAQYSRIDRRYSTKTRNQELSSSSNHVGMYRRKRIQNSGYRVMDDREIEFNWICDSMFRVGQCPTVVNVISVLICRNYWLMNKLPIRLLFLTST